MFSQALRNPMGVEFPSKYALLLLTKKIHPPFHLARLTYPYVELKYPPKKVKYVRCDRRSMFFLVPIHGVGIPKKKIHLDGISEFLLR